MADPFSFAIATVAQIGISYLFPSDGPRIKDLKISASTYGQSIPTVFGLCRVPGNMIWGTQPIEHKKKKWQGKGGYYNQYTYTSSFAMGLCAGPVQRISRIWADSKLIYDTTGSGALVANNYQMRFYMGDEFQVPDSAIVADKGDNAPAFRGMAYIVFDTFLLSDFGNRVPQITAEVYVGESEETVNVSPYLNGEDSSTIPTNYAVGEAAFDWNRDYAYLRYGNDLTQLNLTTSRIIQSFDDENFAFPNGDLLTKLYCIGNDSGIYVTCGAVAAYMPIVKLDGYSLQGSLVFGTTEDASSSPNTDTGFAAPVAMATAYSDQSIEYVATVGAQGQVGCLRCSDMSYQWGADVYVGNAPQVGKTFQIVGADPDTSDNPSFYVLWGDASSITLTHFSGPTQTDVYTVAGSGMTIRGLIWDSATNGAIMLWSMGGTPYISKWALDTAAESWRVAVTGLPTLVSSQSKCITGKFAWEFNDRLYVIDTATGAYADNQVDPSTGDIIEGDGQGYALPDSYIGVTSALQAFDGNRNMLNCFSGVEGTVFLNTVTTGCTVGSILQRLLEQGGLSLGQMDLSAVNEVNVRGFGWASGTDVKSIVSDMQKLYLFDLVEREGILVAVMRGDLGTNNGVVTIPQDVLGSSSADATDFWVETRSQDSDLPAQVTLSYMNYDDDYQTSIARSSRISNPLPTMFSRQQLDMELNVVLTSTEAKAQTRAILYSQWAERTTHQTHLPWAYLDLDPSDVITTNFNDGRTFIDRVQTLDMGADFTLQMSTYSQDSGAYDGWTGIAADGGGTGSQTITPPTIALPFVFNTPLLRDMDDTGGSTSRYYGALANGGTGTFGGGGLYRSTNNIDYDLLSSADNDIEWGSIVGKLPPPPAGNYALDWKTRLRIIPAVSWFELESITDDDLWAGANPCLVGDEVIQFRDAVENDDGSWTIWNLLRGRRGSEYACDNHIAGERFCFLADNTINIQADSTNSRGMARYFKGVGQGKSLGAAPAIQLTYEPRDLMPYAVAYIKRDITSAGMDITWLRRTRLGGNLQDGTGDVALSETSEAYEVYILNGPFSGDLSRGTQPTNYRRMYSTTTPNVTYPISDQGADGFNPLTDTLHLAIYQLSGVVGRGFPGVRDILASSDD